MPLSAAAAIAMPLKGWSRQFDDPIQTGDGGELRTLRDAVSSSWRLAC
jgi:hypothetical protein